MTVPIPRPGKIVCVGLNYSDHAEEQGAELPSAPLLFAKFTTTLIGPGDPIVIPPLVTKCDYEAELGVVIGTTVRGVSKENALRGRRRLRRRERRLRAGPAVLGRAVDARQVARHVLPRRAARARRGGVRPARARDPRDPERRDGAGLDDREPHLRDRRGRSRTSSQTSTLEAGDLILTGTPAGVGVFRDPQRLLRARRRDHDRDRRGRLDHEPGHRGVRHVPGG